MDALISRANFLQPTSKKRKSSLSIPRSPNALKSTTNRSRSAKSQRRLHQSSVKSKSEPKTALAPDATLSSVARRTTIPASFLPPRDPSATTDGKPKQKEAKDAFGHIEDRKLRAKLNSQRSLAASRSTQISNAELLLPTSGGYIEATDALERTWRVTQNDLLENEGVGRDGAAGRRELVLDDGAGGGFKTRWTRNGRHMAIVGRRGHLASVDWMTGGVHAEIQLKETCRDVT